MNGERSSVCVVRKLSWTFSTSYATFLATESEEAPSSLSISCNSGGTLTLAMEQFRKSEYVETKISLSGLLESFEEGKYASNSELDLGGFDRDSFLAVVIKGQVLQLMP